MVGIRNDRRSQVSIKAIQTAIVSLLQMKNISEISISELCKTANVNRGTFYKYYTDLHDVLDQMAVQTQTELLDLIDEQFTKKSTTTFLINLFEFIRQRRAISNFMLQYDESILIQTLKEARTLIVQQENYRELFERHYQIEYEIYGVIGIIREWFRSDLRESPEDLTNMVNKFMN